MADVIIQIMPAPAGFVNAYKDDDDQMYIEPVAGFALVQAGSHQDVCALEAADGDIDLARDNPNYIGTYHSSSPELERLRSRMVSDAKLGAETDR